MKLLNEFQKDIRDTLIKLYPKFSVEVKKMEGLDNYDEVCLRFKYSNIKVWIYSDGAQIVSDNRGINIHFEIWDYKSISELKADLLLKLSKIISD